MFKLVDTPLARARVLVRASALAWLLPFGAMAGITGSSTPESAKAPIVTASTGVDSKATRAAAGTYQIRCWQQGRLLFEENQVSLPADSAKYGVKMTGTDRHGKPIYVADTTNATCLIRSIEDDRGPQR
jgi:hypothetical protein